MYGCIFLIQLAFIIRARAARLVVLAATIKRRGPSCASELARVRRHCDLIIELGCCLIGM